MAGSRSTTWLPSTNRGLALCKPRTRGLPRRCETWLTATATKVDATTKRRGASSTASTSRRRDPTGTSQVVGCWKRLRRAGAEPIDG